MFSETADDLKRANSCRSDERINSRKKIRQILIKNNFYGREPPKITIKIESNTTDALETVYDGYPICIKARSASRAPLRKIYHKGSGDSVFELGYRCSYKNDSQSAYTGVYSPRRQTMPTIDELRGPSEDISIADIVRKVLSACLNRTDGIY